MYFLPATVLALLPIFTVASPVRQVPRARIGLTKHSNTMNSDGTINAANLRAQLAGATNKIQRGFVNYEKNTGQKHPLAGSSNSKRATGKDSLTDDSSQLWYGKINVGSPAVEYTGKNNYNSNDILSNKYPVDFDTGSSDLFLPGPGCGSTCSGHATYDPSKSTTSSNVGQSFSLQYGDGSTVSGKQYTDTVSIAGLTVRITNNDILLLPLLTYILATGWETDPRCC